MAKAKRKVMVKKIEHDTTDTHTHTCQRARQDNERRRKGKERAKNVTGKKTHAEHILTVAPERAEQSRTCASAHHNAAK